MASNRRRAFASAVTVAVVAAAAGCGGAVGGSSEKSADEGPVKVGVLGVLGGQFAVYGPSIINSAKLAVKQLNDKGGVLGRTVELDLGDTQGDPKQAGVLARRLVDRDGVSALVGSISSPEREAAMPTVRRTKIPFLYAADYEGGACDPNVYDIGSVPPTLAPAITYMVKSLPGKSWYFIGSDYDYPKKVNDDIARVVEAAGGTVVGKSLVPMGTNDFSQLIGKISKSKAANVFTTVVAADGVAFVKQGGSFGLWKHARIVTPTIWDDQLPALEPAIDGAYATLAWTPALTRDSTAKFMKAYRAEYGEDVGALSQLGENTYNGIMVWAQAAEKAKSVDFSKVLGALGGITYADAPRGPMTLESDTHHVKMPIYLAKADGAGKYHVVKEFPPTSPGPQCQF